MTIPEQAGKVATSGIDALKGNPLCLAVVALTIVLSLIAYFRDVAAANDKAQIVTTLIERCMEPAKR
jgi:hypothetical protein